MNVQNVKRFTPKRTAESSSQLICITCSSEDHRALLETPPQTTPHSEWDASVVIVNTFEFFINYEKTALQIFFLLCKDVLW